MMRGRMFLVVALVAVAQLAQAGPRLLTYQGSLVAPGGNPVPDGSYDMRFTIYDDAAAGTQRWTESETVTVQRGLYSVVLGDGTAFGNLFNWYYDLWLEVEVDLDADGFDADERYTPRQRVASAAWAMDADKLQGYTAPSFQRRVTGIAPAGSFITAINADGSVVAGVDSAGGTLDDAYDFGGPGAGRTITADSGAVQVLGPNGVQVQGVVESAGRFDLVQALGGAQRASIGNLFSGGGMLRTIDNGGSITAEVGSSGTGGGFAYYYMQDSAVIGAWIDGHDGNSGRIHLARSNAGAAQETVMIDADAGDGAAHLALRDGAANRIDLDAREGTGGALVSLRDAANTTRISLDAAVGTDDARFEMFNSEGNRTVQISADGSGDASYMYFYNAGGTPVIQIDSDVTGDGRITTQELSITGGSDLSEQFDIDPAGGKVEPGMVVCIDSKNAGKLIVSSKAYDRTVAGIVSGAGDVETGLMMGQRGSAADGEHPVALTGRVYCRCDASAGAIEPGDLLTTSGTPGHAMKVDDYTRAHGAILGKAMTPLREGRGLVLVLVALQ